MQKSKLVLTAWLVCASLWAHAQFSLSGTVRDVSGNPLPGANVVLPSLSKATATNAQGKFEMTGVSGTLELNVTYVGYAPFKRTINVNKNTNVDVELKEATLIKEEVIVYATRANEKTPTTYTNFSQKDIENRNLGQDIPFVLNFTPSVVTTSDAGAGIGYTDIRIRGSDATRINVTINGVPVNDSESHGVFWVNMPDIASSLDNIQVQRGVGSSTNGAAAFGATINLQTSTPEAEAFAQIDNTVGSFNTRKHTAIFNTGLIDSKWAFEGRVSQISTDGYIDRARAELKSYFLSGSYYGKKTSLKALVFGGQEVTYQAWYGTPEARLKNDVEGMQAVIANNGFNAAQAQNLLNSGRTYNFYQYDNEVDNYNQDHYQLHINHEASQYLNFNVALHYTYGRGYFEQYRANDRLSNYGLSPIQIGGSTISRTDIIRRRWLDNDFYGMTFSANYTKGATNVTFGGGYNEYIGDHFGEIIWARNAGTTNIRDRYYDNEGEKSDLNLFAKANYQATEKLNFYGDLQYRGINYTIAGVNNNLRNLNVDASYNFINPKVGATFSLSPSANLYASYAVGNREPVRRDFTDAPGGITPSHERLNNIEAGIKKSGGNFSLNANYFLMSYNNQLVLTGELNDVGANIRTNVPSSYRMGIEFEGGYRFTPQWQWAANLTLSQNKIKEFVEFIYDYGVGYNEYNAIEITHRNTDISFSPNVVAGSMLTFSPAPRLDLQLLSKYVGRQYLDNTSNAARSIDAYFINDLKFDYAFDWKSVKHLKISLLVNNVLDVKYETNGYTFGYRGGGSEVRENYFYPQAGRNFLLAMSVKI